nr:hypothetical protein CFP56_04217 [Quercus suber]
MGSAGLTQGNRGCRRGSRRRVPVVKVGSRLGGREAADDGAPMIRERVLISPCGFTLLFWLFHFTSLHLVHFVESLIRPKFVPLRPASPQVRESGIASEQDAWTCGAA